MHVIPLRSSSAAAAAAASASTTAEGAVGGDSTLLQDELRQKSDELEALQERVRALIQDWEAQAKVWENIEKNRRPHLVLREQKVREDGRLFFATNDTASSPPCGLG